MKARDNQDLWAGALFVAVGVLALALGRNLTIGTVAEMGEGFVPRAMSIVLMTLGALIMVVAWFRGTERLERVTLRPQVFVTAAILAFTAALEPLGLIAAISVSVLAANFAGQPLRLRTLATLIVVLCVGVVVVFIWALGLPLTALPRSN